MRQLILQFASSPFCSPRHRNTLYRLLGAEIGEGAFIEPGCRFTSTRLDNFCVGDRAHIDRDCFFDLGEKVVIREFAAIAHGCLFVTTTHLTEGGDREKRVRGAGRHAAVRVGAGAWVCCGVTLLPGSYVGQGAVVGAGTLVLEDQALDHDSLYVGSPARLRKRLTGLGIWDQAPEVAQENAKPGSVSDGYHTFDELYEHRNLLFCLFVRLWGGWKSRVHADGSAYDGWFIAGTSIGGSEITYHLPDKFWDLCSTSALDVAPEWDGHTSIDVLKRMEDFLSRGRTE